MSRTLWNDSQFDHGSRVDRPEKLDRRNKRRSKAFFAARFA